MSQGTSQLKKYLVRSQNGYITGPYTIEDLVASQAKMERSMDDEIAASTGKWVRLEDTQGLMEFYPEVYSFVNNHMLASWGISNHSGIRLATTKKSKKGIWPFLALFTASLALMGLWHMKHRGGVFSALSLSDQLPDGTTLLHQLESQPTSQFISFMDDNIGQIVRQRNRQDWLPLIRAYAYAPETGRGAISKVPARVLRGRPWKAALFDCSIDHLTKRLLSERSALNDLVQGQKPIDVSSPMTRMLLWDPRWLGRRKEPSGWTFPAHYPQGCLSIARNALAQARDRDPESAQLWRALDARLNHQWQLSRNPAHKVASSEVSGTLSALSCRELANDPGGLEDCQWSSGAVHTSWRELFSRLEKWSHAHWALTQSNRNLQLGALANLTTQLAGNDQAGYVMPYSGLDYAAEKRYLELRIQGNQNPDEALKATQSQFPNFIAYP